MNPQIRKILLVLIIIVGSFFRFYQLSQNPPSLYSDEVAIAYNAHSILTTGKDEFGASLPLSFRSFNDFKPPLVIYLVTASQAIFGATDLATRFPAALFGVISIFLIYQLTHQLKLSTNISLLTTLLFAINPWHIMLSRVLFEVAISLTFVLAATNCFLLARKKPFFLLASAVFFSASLYTYHSARLFAPLFLLSLAIIYRRTIFSHKKAVISATILGLLLSAPLALELSNPDILVRPKGLSIFTNLPSIDPYKRELNYLINDQPTFFSKLIHNRRLASLYLILPNYLKHLSPEFIFTQSNTLKFSITHTGPFYIFEAITIPLGIVALFKTKFKRRSTILIWLFLSPLASAFAFAAPSLIRALYLVVPLTILSAIGLRHLIFHTLKPSLALQIIFTGLVFIPLTLFVHNYFVHYPQESIVAWDGQYKQLFDFVKPKVPKYQKIIFLPEVGGDFSVPHIFLLYYLGYSPEEYLAQGGTEVCRFGHSGDYNFGKFEFRTANCYENSPPRHPLKNLPADSLLIVAPSSANKIISDPLHVIYDNQQNSLISVYETNQLTLVSPGQD